MSRDSSRTYIHLAEPRFADLFEDFTRTPLLPEEIYVAPQHQPINPEDEDDVVPDQHAAFGIQRATQQRRQPAWKDLGLEELMTKGPSEPVKATLAHRIKGNGEGSSSSGLPR